MNYLTNSELLRAVMNAPDATPLERVLADRLWDVMEELEDKEAVVGSIRALLP